MWKYLIFNAVWFSFLSFAAFFENKFLRISALFLWVVLSVTALKYPIDPFAWGLYTASSFLVLWIFFQFRRWSVARSLSLAAEVASLAKKLEEENALLQKKVEEVHILDRRVEGALSIYDKIGQMSQSLHSFETFLIFGEALYKNAECGPVKLVVFGDSASEGPKEIFELRSRDFQGVFDRSLFLNDPQKKKAVLFSPEQVIVSQALEKRSPVTVETEGSALAAHPIFIDDKVSAVLLIENAAPGDKGVISILAGRFLSEIQRVELYERIETLAITDGLTGVYVRRHLLERFEKEIDRSERFGFKLSFLMIDIDYFKHFNDRYGHLVGDAVLKQVAETIKASVRELDLVGRYGGEEFGVLLIETDASTAFFVAQRIRQAVEERIFRAYDESPKVTVSIGCSTYSPKLNSIPLIINAADSALYQAKKQGRNKVCVSTLLEEKV